MITDIEEGQSVSAGAMSIEDFEALVLRQQSSLRPFTHQPQWPNGGEPDRISNIEGGLSDGKHNRYMHSHAHSAVKIEGRWFWVVSEKANKL